MTAKKIGGALVAAAALAAVPAPPADGFAFVGPACTARIANGGPGASGSCSFSAASNARITVVTDRVVTATVSCYSYPYSWTASREVYDTANWVHYGRGSCSLTLVAGPTGANAAGTAVGSLNTNIIADPYPVP